MGNEQKMIDRIIADAKQEAQEILDKAKSEADLKVNSANEKAEKEMASYTKLAEAEAEKAASKEISGAYKKGIKVSDETRDITGGFIVKKGDIEYNYSFEAIIAVEHEYIEQIAAEILFN